MEANKKREEGFKDERMEMVFLDPVNSNKYQWTKD